MPGSDEDSPLARMTGSLRSPRSTWMWCPLAASKAESAEVSERASATTESPWSSDLKVCGTMQVLACALISSSQAARCLLNHKRPALDRDVGEAQGKE